jgi:hypothetical protein
MVFGMFSITLLVVAAALILLGLKLLFHANWFMQFLRGFAGFGLITVATLIIMVGLNLASYAQISEKQDLANISFTKVNEQTYEATLVSVSSGEETKFTIEGDMWQVSGRVLTLFGSPFYRLDSLAGRYYTLEQQRSSAESINIMPDNSIGLDLWGWFKGKDVGLISTAVYKTRFLPLADGAVFTVSIGEFELLSAPVNDAAKSINSEWQ